MKRAINLRLTSLAAVLVAALLMASGFYAGVQTNGFISSDQMHYYVKDYQGNVRQVTDADGKVEQDNHYYPYGMLMGESSNILASAHGYKGVSFNPYLFGSKEYLTTGSANLLDFTARTYDPTTLLFQTQYPEATKFTPFNSYLYCASDPINHIDPDGRIVYIVGTDPKAARSQLQSKIGDSMTLKLDEEGNLTYERNEPDKKLKGNAKKLAGIIDDKTVTVYINTTDSKSTSDGYFFVGGAFLGTSVKVEDGVTVVKAGQYVNTTVLKKIDDATRSKPGTGMLHELTEAYQGALISQKKGVESPRSGVQGTVYDKAHRRATPIPADVHVVYYDQNWNELLIYNNKVPPATIYVQWYVIDRNGNRVVVQDAQKIGQQWR